jgi:methanethiol S-methyltransferase
MKRVTIFLYGVACYVLFLATFLYAVGFIGNIFVPKSIDSGANIPLLYALGVNLLLLSVFAVQHSVMARPWFKQAWTQVVPEPAERSTYVLLSSVALILLFRFWQPMGGVIWSIENGIVRAVIYAGFAAGWLIVLLSTFLINHFDLFGLRQVYLFLRRRPYTHLEFRTPFFYRYVRHPLYFGWLLTFWCAPVMTAAHLVFAIMTTAYILIAIRWEEADMVKLHGPKYIQYRQDVPMILPVRTPAPLGKLVTEEKA